MIMSYNSNISFDLPLKIDVVQNLGYIECVRNIIDQEPAKHSLGEDFFNLLSLPDYISENTIQGNFQNIGNQNSAHHKLSNIFGMEGDKQSQLLDVSNMDLNDFQDVTRNDKYVNCSIIGNISEEIQLSDTNNIIENKSTNTINITSNNSTPLILQKHDLNNGKLELIKSNILVEDSDTLLSHVKSIGPNNNDISILNNDGSSNLILQDNENIQVFNPIKIQEEDLNIVDNHNIYKVLPSETYDIIKISPLDKTIEFLNYVDDNKPNHKIELIIDKDLPSRSALFIANHFFSSIRAINKQSYTCDVYAAGGIGKIMMSLLALQTMFIIISTTCISYFNNKDVRIGEDKIVFSDGSQLLLEILKLDKNNIISIKSDTNFSSTAIGFTQLLLNYNNNLCMKNPKLIKMMNNLYIRHIDNSEIKGILLNYINNPEKSHSTIRKSIFDHLLKLI
ncbi:hypothetical protein IOLA_291 [uncultured bacterium]|nr:hypothetical protein IOLA_291 [uncultured bacterium]